MTEEELRQWLRAGATDKPTAAPAKAKVSGAPKGLFDAVSRGPLMVAGLPESQKIVEREFIAANTAPDAPLDVRSGLPAGTRAKLSFERDPLKKAEWLAQQPGIEGVRTAGDGEGLIARVKDRDGRPKDILLDERGLTMKDFADMTGALPEITAGALAAYFTGGSSLLWQAGVSAGSSALAGAASDVATRAGRGADIDPAEIAQARGTQAAIDFALPLGIAGGKRLAQVAVGPFASNAGQLQREAAEAAARLGVPLTAAQRTGSPMLARAEAFASKLPGGGALADQATAQEEAIKKVQEFLLNGPASAVPTGQSISDRAGSVLAGEYARESGEALALRTKASDLAQTNIDALLNAKISPANLTTSDAGSMLRTRLTQLRDQFRAESRANYDAVYQSAGGAEVTVPTDAVRSLVGAIRKDTSPAARKLVPEIQRIFNVGASLSEVKRLPIIYGAEGQIAGPLLEVVPKRLPLNQAIELRSLINDAIARGDPIGGIPDRYLKKLAGALTVSIEQGVDSAPNKTLGLALKQANQHYKQNLAKFEQRGVADLFAEANQGSFIDDSRAVKRVFGGQGDIDLLRRYEQVLGSGSNEFRALVRTGLRAAVDESTPLGERFIDAGSFLQRLRTYDPEVRKKMLGPIEKELIANTQLLAHARGAKIDVADLDKIITARPTAAAKELRAAITKEQMIDKRYGARVMKDLMDGHLNPAQLNADEFVSRFVSNASTQDLRQVLMTLKLRGGDELVNDVRKRTMLDLLNRASRPITAEDAVSASKLGDLAYDRLGTILKTEGEKLNVVLGKESMDSLGDLSKVLAVRSKANAQAGAAGSLVTSNVLASLLDFRIGELPRIVKNRVVAGLLTKPGVKTWLASQQLIPATPYARKAVFASPPIVRALLEEFRAEPDKLGQALDAINSGEDANEVRASRDREGQIRDWLKN